MDARRHPTRHAHVRQIEDVQAQRRVTIDGNAFTLDGLSVAVHWHNLTHPGNVTNVSIASMHQQAAPNLLGDGVARSEPGVEWYEFANVVTLANGVNFSLPLVESGMLFLNNGSGAFTKVERFPYDRADDGWPTEAAAFADVDGDGDVRAPIRPSNHLPCPTCARALACGWLACPLRLSTC